MDPDIALFVEVVDAGSLSGAARIRGLSPAMVSKRIARLEARLGVRLLVRTTRRLDLTGPGERFHADAVAILAALSEAEARVSGRDGTPAGPLRVSAPTSFGRMLIAPHLATFLDAYPRVALEVDLTDAMVDLAAGRIDLAIRIAADIPPSLHARRLASSPRVLCASPAYLATFGTPAKAADLARHRILATVDQLPWRLAGRGRTLSVDGPSHVRTNSSDLIRELALGGVGVALRSLWDVGEALSIGALVRVLPDYEGSARVAIHAVFPTMSPSAAGIALVEHLVACWRGNAALDRVGVE